MSGPSCHALAVWKMAMAGSSNLATSRSSQSVDKKRSTPDHSKDKQLHSQLKCNSSSCRKTCAHHLISSSLLAWRGTRPKRDGRDLLKWNGSEPFLTILYISASNSMILTGAPVFCISERAQVPLHSWPPPRLT